MDSGASLRATDGRLSPVGEGLMPVLLASQQDREREGRIFYLLFAAWIINIFDLSFTLMALERQFLTELNPLAAWFVHLGPNALVIYKFTLLFIGSTMLWWSRRTPWSEVGAWTYAGVCVLLTFWWRQVLIDAEPIWITLNSVPGAHFNDNGLFIPPLSVTP